MLKKKKKGSQPHMLFWGPHQVGSEKTLLEEK